MNKIFESYSFSGESVSCYGLEVVKRNLAKRNIQVLPFDENSKNPVLFSIYWPEQIFDFIKFRFQHCMKGRTVICGGNTATTNPSILLPFCDYVFLGDGENWDGTFDHENIISKTTKIKKNISVCKNISPFEYEDIQQSRRSFCEISRGCKNKCLFCQYGWLKPYRECDIENIKIILNTAKTKSIRFFAADRFQHSRYLDIRGMIERKGKCDTGSDMSVKFILENPDYLKFTNKVRVGIEGMSERLRFLIGKKYTDDDLVRFCKMVADNGIKCLDWYMIYGLPTERKEDVFAFKELMKRIDSIMPEGYTIAIHWNAFTPSSMTPFQTERSALNYDTETLKKSVFETHENKRIKIYHKPKLTSKETIMIRLLSIRSGEQDGKLFFNMAYNMSKFLKDKNFIFKEFKNNHGHDLDDVISENTELPWDKYVNYPKKTFEIIKNYHLKKHS